ncbi:hypothetical protein JTB14_006719 [Gonioctena quinquepunctata]|nr:hypothetical protein JTB14_006719 [Gonioctena quinquepunctata]
MSTFSGKIQEIPHISVDRFDGENVGSEAYFLSHCHSDHMVGLTSYFAEQMVKTRKYLYASEISCVILKKMFPKIAYNLKELHLESPTTVNLTKCSFSVTPIPAGHCPGSVMFLFEGNKQILYTGDYRIGKSDIAKFKSFYNYANELKNIHKIYLDTTFFRKCYSNFPTREESLKEICEVIGEWKQRGNQFLIKFITGAWYGYEYVFKEIFKKFNMPVHVSEKIYSFYSLIPEMDESVTTDGSSTQIHCNCGPSFRQMCDFGLDSFVKTVKISAWRWTQNDFEEGSSNFESGIHFICYSTHASYEEGVELIRLLKPKEIEICVEYKDPYANREMSKLIQEHLREFEPKDEEVEETPKLFPVTSRIIPRKKNEGVSDDLGILASPPRDTSYMSNSTELLEVNGKPKYNIDAIVSPVRKIKISDKILQEPIASGETLEKISEIIEIEDSSEDFEVSEISSVMPPSRNESSGSEGCKDIILNIVDGKSDIFNLQGDTRYKERGLGIEHENLEEKDSVSNSINAFQETEKCEESILMSIIDSQSQIAEDIKGEKSEECVILNIINSPPTKRKK